MFSSHGFFIPKQFLLNAFLACKGDFGRVSFKLSLWKVKPLVNINNQSKPKGPKIQILSHLLRIALYGAIMATLFTAWTPLGLLPVGVIEWWTDIRTEMRANADGDNPIQNNNQTQEERMRVGVVAGHWGNDSGAVCPDGLEEVQINVEIASYVQKYLKDEGFDADLMMESLEVLEDYEADALISIHADTCAYIDPNATGYKVTPILGTQNITESNRLNACVMDRYAAATKMSFHTSITADMQNHQAFVRINPNTPAILIETGFMNLDRKMLTENPDVIARGIVNGLLCYLNDESVLSGP